MWARQPGFVHAAGGRSGQHGTFHLYFLFFNSTCLLRCLLALLKFIFSGCSSTWDRGNSCVTRRRCTRIIPGYGVPAEDAILLSRVKRFTPHENAQLLWRSGILIRYFGKTKPQKPNTHTEKEKVRLQCFTVFWTSLHTHECTRRQRCLLESELPTTGALLAYLFLEVGVVQEALRVEFAGVGAEDGRVHLCESLLAAQRVPLLNLC